MGIVLIGMSQMGQDTHHAMELTIWLFKCHYFVTELQERYVHCRRHSEQKISIYTYNKIYHNTVDLKSLNIHGYRVNRHKSDGARHPPCNGVNDLVVQMTLFC
jgi:hypothetical protein